MFLTHVCVLLQLTAVSLSGAQTPPTLPLPPGDEQSAELDLYRNVITTSSDPASRRQLAESLLRLESDASTALAVELLGMTSTPVAPIALCEAIASVGATDPDRLDARLVDPLLQLLVTGIEQFSSASATALSTFRSAEVSRQLGRLASDSSKPPAHRLAAIEALAPNVDRRDVVRELIGLLDVEEAQIITRVLTAVREASRVEYGSDVAAWKAWWQRKSTLDDRRWLSDRLDLAKQRGRAVEQEYQSYREAAATHGTTLARRIDALLRRVHALTTQPARKDALLLSWLVDPLVEYRLAALGIVRDRIADGDGLSDETKDAVRSCLGDESDKVRIAALEIIGNLKEPGDAPAVTALLATDHLSPIRETILRTLGRLDNPEAIGALLAELGNPAARVECVREAVRALGTLGAKGRVTPETIKPAVQPLLDRFRSTAADDLSLKEPLLTAMALIGDDAFTPEFVAHLSSDSSELLPAAIRGIDTVGATDHLNRLLEHLSNADPRVRQLSASVLGRLGSDDAHLHALINRLSPATEANEAVRTAAWEGFRSILSRTSPATQIRWTDELRAYPERRITLLADMIAGWSTDNSAPEQLIEARIRISEVLQELERHSEALPHLQKLLETTPVSADPRFTNIAGMYWRACLESGDLNAAREFISQNPAHDDDTSAILCTATCDYLAAAREAGKEVDVEAVLALVDALPEYPLGRPCNARLDKFRTSSKNVSPPDEGHADPEP